jgi:peptide chain release factor 2
LARSRCDFDLAGKEGRLADLEKQAGAPSLWDDPQHAQAVLRETTRLRDEVGVWRRLEASADEALELLELAEAESDERVTAEVEAEASALEAELGQLEFRLHLGGPYDERSAILAVHSGAGGTESQDWAEMLMRMYLHWAERRRFATTILDLTEGEEAGIKSVTIEIDGAYAYGYLRSERGVHRLVRLSPFDSAHRRHTSFALVEVMPEVEEAVELQVNPDDLRIDVFRSSGAGGQNVQKTSTAIRITHLPTGIVVTCQNERSQIQNRETAMKILQSRLLELEQEKREAEQATIRGQHVDAGWGNQIRSYVLHPYNMVKDHRTEFETSNTGAVLDGDLDAFVESYLRSQVGVEP